MTWPHASSQTSGYILSDEKSFYYRFERDLIRAKEEVVIESPFITVSKMKELKPLFLSLIRRGLRVFVLTRHPDEHEGLMAEQSEEGIRFFEDIGVQVLMCRNHHRKIAMIDRRIVWKGSLNILSHRNSREFMEREEDIQKAQAMYAFLQYDKVCKP